MPGAGADRRVDHGLIIGLADDDHPHYLNAARHAADAHTFVSHDTLANVSADDHHTKAHAHDGADGSGTVAHSALTGIGTGDHHAQAHVLAGADHTASGLTIGHVLTATGATTFAWQALPAGHAQVHALVSSDHTVAGLTTGHVLQALSATTVGFAAVPAPPAHAASHKNAGTDEIDGDQLALEWVPANFTPTDVAETTGTDELAAYLKGIDLALAPLAWIAPTLLNSWVNYGAGECDTGYCKDRMGVVHIKGTVKNGSSAAAVIFTLPVGYRPAQNRIFCSMTGVGNNAQRLNVYSSGNVAMSTGSTGYTSIEVSFLL